MVSRYSTEPGQSDRDTVRVILMEEEIGRPADNPAFVAAFLAGIVDDLATADDPVMARRIAYGRALIDMVEESFE